MDLLKAMRILIPPATQSLEYKDADLAAFYEYYALSPSLGRPGRHRALRRPLRRLHAGPQRPAPGALAAAPSDRHFMIASEAGVLDCAPRTIVAKGKLGPGEMIAVDLCDGRLLDSDAIDAINRARAPYKRWLKQGMTYLHTELIDPALAAEPFDAGDPARASRSCSSSPARNASRSCARWPRPSRKPPARWATTCRWRCCRSRCGRCTTTSARPSRRSPTRRSIRCARTA